MKFIFPTLTRFSKPSSWLLMVMVMIWFSLPDIRGNEFHSYAKFYKSASHAAIQIEALKNKSQSTPLHDIFFSLMHPASPPNQIEGTSLINQFLSLNLSKRNSFYTQITINAP